MSVDLERPTWHASASCRGDGRYLVDRHTSASAEELRRICRACPVAGECLRETFELEPVVRACGVLRCGVLGDRAWRRLEPLVAELAPVTLEDWTTTAAWILDGDAEEVDVVRERRRPGVGLRVTTPSGRVERITGALLELAHYDAEAEGRGMTRAEITAARRSA